MEIIRKVKKDKKLLAILVVLGILLISLPYATIPLLVAWWFYKKSHFSKKTKLIATGIAGVFTIIVVTFIGIAYAKDVQPHLKVTEPIAETTIKGQQITIKGTYDPADRKVWVNGRKITTSNGSFETTYELKEGANEIKVSAGNLKRATVTLKVTREPTGEEKVTGATPTPNPTPSPTLTPSASQISTPTVMPTSKPAASVLEKINNLTTEKYSSFDVLIYNDKAKFAKEGETPYEIMLISDTTIYSSMSCFSAKNISYNLIVDLYNDPEIRSTLSRVFISMPGYLDLSIGANDGVPMAEKGLLGGVNGPTNFWNTLVGFAKDEVGNMKNWTWGSYLTKCK